MGDLDRERVRAARRQAAELKAEFDGAGGSTTRAAAQRADPASAAPGLAPPARAAPRSGEWPQDAGSAPSGFWRRPQSWLVYLMGGFFVLGGILTMVTGGSSSQATIDDETYRIEWHFGGAAYFQGVDAPAVLGIIEGLIGLAVGALFVARLKAGWIAMLVLVVITTLGSLVMLAALAATSDVGPAQEQAMVQARGLAVLGVGQGLLWMALLASPWVRGVFWRPVMHSVSTQVAGYA